MRAGTSGGTGARLNVDISTADKALWRDFILAYRTTKYTLSFGKYFIPELEWINAVPSPSSGALLT